MSRGQRNWRRLRFVALAAGLLLIGKSAWFEAMAPAGTGQDAAGKNFLHLLPGISGECLSSLLLPK